MPQGLDPALRSELSWKVIDLLAGRALSAADLQKKLGVPAEKLWTTLERLEGAGVLSRRGQERSPGDREEIYVLKESVGGGAFPPRAYMMLGEVMFRGISKSLGPESARMVLHDIGLKAGEEMGEEILTRTGGAAMGPDEFVEHYIEGVLAPFGAFPRVISKSRDHVEYEQLNCPFQDLADRFPGLMCDAMDEGMHKGIDRKFSVATDRVLCKGHGDASCRFRVKWPAQKPAV